MKNNELAVKLLTMIKDELEAQKTMHLNAWHNNDAGALDRRKAYRSWTDAKEYKIETMLKEVGIVGIVNITSEFSLLYKGQMYYLTEDSFKRLVARS